MSVRKGDRTESNFDVLNLIRNLTTYTLQTVRNEKIFPKSQRWLMSQKIANECIEAYSCIMGANAVWVSTESDYAYRRGLQVEAHSHLASLLALIDIAYITYSIDGKKIEYWTKLCHDADMKLKSWTKSEAAKYKNMG